MDLQSILDMDDRAAAYMELTKLYTLSTEAIRKDIVREWPYARAWIVPDTRTLACHAGMKYSSKERAVALLLWSSLAGPEPDYRDDIMYLATIYWGAKMAGLDADQLFAHVAKISEPAVARLILSFVERAPQQKSLEAFDLEVYIKPNGDAEVFQHPGAY